MVFNHPVVIAPDLREEFGEERWIALGWLRATIAVVVYVERCGHTIRIISARKAARHEARHYAQRVAH